MWSKGAGGRFRAGGEILGRLQQGRRRWLGYLVLVTVTASFAVAVGPASAAITNLTAGDPTSDTPEDSFTDDMGIEAIGTSTVRGGILCVVDAAVTDPGDNSLTCDHPAFGGSHSYIGVGSFFLPLVPPALPRGTYRLLGDGDAEGTEPDILSQPFTVSPCTSCDPEPAKSIFQAWKDYAAPIAADGAIACALYNTEGDKSKRKLAIALVRNTISGPPNYVAIASAVGGFAFANLIDEAPEMSMLDKWLAVMHAVTCRAANMYRDIANDPPDPDYGFYAVPQFAVPALVSDEQTRGLWLALDEIRANGEAQLTSAQRFEGAQADNAQSAMAAQAQLVASYGQAMASEMSNASDQLAAFADRLQGAGVGADPLSQTDADAAASFAQRIHDSGFTQDELDQMSAAGLDTSDVADLQTTWGSEPSPQPAVGTSLQRAIRKFADDLKQGSVAEAQFSNQFADFGDRGHAPALKAVVTSPVTTSQLAPYAARFSAGDSAPGTSPIVSYHWDFGDGAKDDGVETSHLYSAPGSYAVTLTVTDADGHTASDEYTVTVISRDQLQLPYCEDATGIGTTPQCDGFDPLQPGTAFTVAGAGPQEVKIRFAVHGGAWNNTLVWFPVDDAEGRIDGLDPAQPGWLTAAESRMQTAFEASASPGDTLTLHLQGGQHFALGLATADLASILAANPLNLPTTTAGFDLQLSAPNEFHSIQALPYRRRSDGTIQIGFEDIPGDASDYTDNVYDVQNVGQSTPAELSTTATADQAQVPPGGNDGYELKVLNDPIGATVLNSFTDTLPAGFAYVAGSTRGATTADPQVSGQTLTWTGHFMAPGGGVAGVHFMVKASSSPGTYLDQGSADAGGIPVSGSGPSAPVTVSSSPAAPSAGPSPGPGATQMPPAPLPPANVIPPAIGGNRKAGSTLSCSAGTWMGDPSLFSYQWNRYGSPLPGATQNSYQLQALDEGSTIACLVTAANAAGQASAASSPVAIPVPKVPGCPAASGGVSSTKLGLVALGMTRRAARRAYAHSSDRKRKYEDFFCLTPIGVRDGYASPKLLLGVRTGTRRSLSGRVVWASTANPYYSIDGIRPGETFAAAQPRLPHGNLFRVGLNYWYAKAAPGGTVLLKVRQGIVEEIGIADRRLTQTVQSQQRFVTSFS